MVTSNLPFDEWTETFGSDRLSNALLDRLLNRARLFHKAIDSPAIPPDNLELYLVSGDAEPTPAVLSINSKTGKVKIVKTAPGDGTVLRQSSLLDEREGGIWQPRLQSPIKFEQVLFLPDDHLVSQRAKPFGIMFYTGY